MATSKTASGVARVRTLHVGTTQGYAGLLAKDGQHVFSYASEVVADEVAQRSISLTMPIRTESYKTTPLLPVFQTFLPVWPIHITNRSHLDVGGVGDRFEQITPAGSHADAAHADRLGGGFGRENRRCKGGSGSQRGGCLAGAAQKLAAVQVEFIVHRLLPFRDRLVVFMMLSFQWAAFLGSVRGCAEMSCSVASAKALPMSAKVFAQPR